MILFSQANKNPFPMIKIPPGVNIDYDELLIINFFNYIFFVQSEKGCGNDYQLRLIMIMNKL